MVTDSMQDLGKESQLIFVAIGVVVFSVLAVVSFIMGAGQIVFYIFAILAIALGFYLSYTLSKEQPKSDQGRKRK